MKIQKIILLIATLLNIFCAQELVCAAAAGVGNLEAQIFKAANNLYDNNGNIDPNQKKQLKHLISKLNFNQIKNLLAQFKNEAHFDHKQNTLIHLLLVQIIKQFGNELGEQDLIELIQLAKKLKADRAAAAGSLRHNFPGGSREAIWANMGPNLTMQFLGITDKDIIYKMEYLLKSKMAKSMQNREKLLIKEQLVQAFQNNTGIVRDLLDLIAEYATKSDKEALEAVVLPDIKKTEESCVIA